MTIADAEIISVLENIYPRSPGVRHTAERSGLFVVSPFDSALSALNAAQLNADDRFIDLGSGDGRIVAMAALLGACSCGVEIDAELHKQALIFSARLTKLISSLKMPAPSLNMTLRCGDILKIDLTSAGILFYYAGGCVSRQHELYSKIEAEMPPNGRLLILRTQRIPSLNLSLSSLSQPPYFYLFKREADSDRIRP